MVLYAILFREQLILSHRNPGIAADCNYRFLKSIDNFLGKKTFLELKKGPT